MDVHCLTNWALSTRCLKPSQHICTFIAAVLHSWQLAEVFLATASSVTEICGTSLTADWFYGKSGNADCRRMTLQNGILLLFEKGISFASSEISLFIARTHTVLFTFQDWWGLENACISLERLKNTQNSFRDGGGTIWYSFPGIVLFWHACSNMPSLNIFTLSPHPLVYAQKTKKKDQYSPLSDSIL